MALSLPPRSFLSYTIATNSTPAAAEEYSRLLCSNSSHPNLETLLSRSTIPLTPFIVDCVLRHCSSSCHASVLCFFVCAGLLPCLRHSAAAYAAAISSLLLLLPSRPHCLLLLLDSYRQENSPGSSKTFRILLNLCRAAVLPSEALAILKRMPEFGCRSDTTSYNSVLRLLGSSSADAVVGLMEEMTASGVLLDMVTIVSTVRALCRSSQLAAARELVAHMSLHGCMPNVVIYSALLDGACACGELDAAMEIWKKRRDMKVMSALLMW